MKLAMGWGAVKEHHGVANNFGDRVSMLENLCLAVQHQVSSSEGNVIIGIIGYRWLSNLSSVPCLSGVVSQVCWSVRVVLHLVYAPSSRC